MAFLLEILGLIMKPFVLVRLSCQFGLQSIFIVIQTWIELLRAAIYLHLVIFWKLAIVGIAVLSLPVRAFLALFRERMLEMQVRRMKRELENILWDKKELQERLWIAIRERKMMEAMLRELENEHDEAIVKIELLEGEVHDLKDEIQRLKEHQGKLLLDYKHDAKNTSSPKISNNFVTPLQHKSSHHIDAGPVPKHVSKDLIPEPTKASIVLSQDPIQSSHREIALSRSLFSAILSLIVGIIVWEAKDPCLPLVMALFTVVTMSLMSVVQFYATIEHKPASDTVALLSFNWFVLGTLAYPMLPRVARALVPLTEWVFEWLGL